MGSGNVAEAKQKFSELLRAAGGEPQTIYNRGRRVAVVVDAAAYGEFEAWRSERGQRSLADLFEQLRDLSGKERYTLRVPVRRDRVNRFAKVLG